ncbi:flagellar hook-length control protein FliK [Vibrio cholerae]
MNVNLTPPVEPSKIAPTAKSSAVSTDAAATESSGGFFAQLHALIFGSKTASDAPATSVTQTVGDTEAPVNTEAALEADSDAALMAEIDDALFSASEVEAASEESLPVDVIKSAQKAPSLEKGEAISAKAAPVKQDEQGANASIPASLAKWVTNADDSVSGELQRKTAQAMSEGDELLGRLQEANQALIKTNGKILPALTPELKAMLEEGGKAKASVPNALAQSVAQGLTPAHLAAQQTGTTALPMNPTAATPIDIAALAPQTVAANPMLNPAATVNPELAASSAMLAALGGRALVGSDERRALSESGQEGLAQQIAAAAGQGTAQNQALNRAESQLVQTNATPVPLNKEMAADQLAERVQMMMSKNLKNIDIRLDPPELGRMHIRMNMQGDGATVHFTVANQHAREALEQTMPRLREMLAQQGVQLGDTSVQQQSAGQQQRYTGQEQSGFGQSARNERLNSEENLDTDIKLDLNVATKRDGISYYA